MASIPAAISLAQEEVGRRLDQRPGGDQRRHPLVHVRGEVALGVGDQRPVAALGEVLDPALEAVAERPRRRLQQDPAAAAERDPGQLLLAEALDRGLRHLAARPAPSTAIPSPRRWRLSDSTRPASSSMRTSWSWRMCGVAQIASIPSAAAWRASAGAVAEVERAVVDAGKDVAVQVDQMARPPKAQNLVQRSPRTGTGLR